MTSVAPSTSRCQQETLVCHSGLTDPPTSETLAGFSGKTHTSAPETLTCRSESQQASLQEGLVCQSDKPTSGSTLQQNLPQQSGECLTRALQQDAGDGIVIEKSPICDKRNENSLDSVKSPNSIANSNSSSCRSDSVSQNVWVCQTDSNSLQGETSHPNDSEILQSHSSGGDNSNDSVSNPISEGTASDSQNNTPSLSDGLQRSDSNSSSPGRSIMSHSRLEPVISLHYSTEGTTSSTIHLGFAAFENLEAGVLQRSAEDASLNPLVSGPAQETVSHASKGSDRGGSDAGSHLSGNESSNRPADGRLQTVSEEEPGEKCSNCGEHLDTEKQERQSSVSESPECSGTTSSADKVPLCGSTSTSQNRLSAGVESEQAADSKTDNSQTALWGECSGTETSESTVEKQTRIPSPRQSG